MKLPMITALLLCSMHGLRASDKKSVPIPPIPSQPAIGIYAKRGKQPTYEDRFHYRFVESDDKAAKGFFMGIYDGHGGTVVADFVATNVPHYFEQQSGPPAEKMRKSFVQLDNHDSIKQQKKCGSTATVVFIPDDFKKIYCAHIGDSRLLLEKNGAIDCVTCDHVPSREDEKMRIKRLMGNVSKDRQGVWRVEGYLSVSRSFGDWCAKRYITAEPECMEKELTSAHRFLILATDGLWRVMGNAEVMEAVNAYMKRYPNDNHMPQSLAAWLGTMATMKKSNDDITILVVDLLLLASRVCKKKEVQNLLVL